MDIQLGRSRTVRRAYGIDEIALVPGGRTVDPAVTDSSWTLGGVTREIPIIASAMDGGIHGAAARHEGDLVDAVGAANGTGAAELDVHRETRRNRAKLSTGPMGLIGADQPWPRNDFQRCCRPWINC